MYTSKNSPTNHNAFLQDIQNEIAYIFTLTGTPNVHDRLLSIDFSVGHQNVQKALIKAQESNTNFK